MNELNNTLVKYNMDNLTFILPLFIENMNDYTHFLFTINYLINVCPEANFIIHEIGDIDHLENINHRKIKKIFTKASNINKKYYKTWCVSKALEQIKTKIICIYDYNFLIPLNSIQNSLQYIFEGYSLVIPYSYGMYQKEILNFKEECNFFIKSLNFNDFKIIKENNSMYGNIEFYDAISYIKLDCLNENIIDFEFLNEKKLFKMYSLDYKVKCLDNSYVWHLENYKIKEKK